MAFDNRQKDRNLIHVSIILMLLVPSLCNGVGNALTAQPVNTPPPAASKQPPVEQPLIPEGVFAKQLAEALQLGSALDEQQAEALLSNSGIEPKNGWINEYPVTPAVLGDIENGLTAAGNQGKLGTNSLQALKILDELEKGLGLAVKPEQSRQASQAIKKGNTTVYSYTDKQGRIFYTDNYDSIPQEYRDKTKIIGQSTPQTTGNQTAESVNQAYRPNLDPSIVDSYYNNPGPPVLTYYPPPDPYLYLYSWVPYSFSSYGFYFPGYFMLNSFYRHVTYNRQLYVISHYGAGTGFNNRLTANPGFPVSNFSNSGSFQTRQVRPHQPYPVVTPVYH